MTVTAEQWARALVGHALTVGEDGRGAVVKRLAPSLGTVAFRTGDRDRRTPECPRGATVPNVFGDGVDYAPCAHCGTHWPTNASRTVFEWCHDTYERAHIREHVATICADTGTAEWVLWKALEWADKYYLPEHLRPGCNACN